MSVPDDGALPALTDHSCLDAAELRAEIAALTSQVHVLVESHRTQEVEIAAARRDLDVKAAYIAMLERTHAEQQTHLEALHSHLRKLDTVSYGDLPAATARAIRAEQQVDVEQQRVAEATRAAAEASQWALAAEAEVSAFRKRTSTVVADAVGRRLRKRGRLYQSLRRMLRTLSGD